MWKYCLKDAQHYKITNENMCIVIINGYSKWEKIAMKTKK